MDSTMKKIPRQEQISLFGATAADRRCETRGASLAVAGLFSGIGGLELGLHRAGHRSLMLCENDPGATAVLRERFPGVELHGDIRELRELPNGTEFVVGGFPCQDLSQAGLTAGIKGKQSSLVGEVFRLLSEKDIPWVLLENVPFMLRLGKGEALDLILREFEKIGYDWAYRIIDSRAMGVPQRRARVFILASKAGDPRDVLLVGDAGEPDEVPKSEWRNAACGFYWTEGVRGLGWAHDAVPTLKGGSTLGIPSPPAIVLRSGDIVKPDIRDAERMQGFEPDWTLPASNAQGVRSTHRWKLVGNAVTVDVAEWIGSKLKNPGRYDPTGDEELNRRRGWPRSVWSIEGRRYTASVSAWPERRTPLPLEDFLQFDVTPLSSRAIKGFLSRAQRGSLRFPPGFIKLMEHQIRKSIYGREDEATATA